MHKVFAHPSVLRRHFAIEDPGCLINEEPNSRIARDVLANYGNMSSLTVWFVLREILDMGVLPGDWVIMVAFGAGLSAHAFLLRA